MGVDKASMVVRGETLLGRVAGTVQHLGTTHIVGGDASLVRLVSRDGRTHAPLHVPDVVDSPGPFGALVDALARHGSNSDALVLSCDLAQVTRAHIDRLLDSRESTDADYAVPLVQGRRQWHSIAFSPRITSSLSAAHENGVRSLRRGFLGHSECTVISHDASFFSDVDTPEDVERLGASNPTNS